MEHSRTDRRFVEHIMEQKSMIVTLGLIYLTGSAMPGHISAWLRRAFTAQR